jgi:hypothetical protein
LARRINVRCQIGGRGLLFCALVGSPLSSQYVRILPHRPSRRADVDKQVTTTSYATPSPSSRAAGTPSSW